MGKSKHKKHHRHDLDEDDEGSSQDGTGSSAGTGGGEGSGPGSSSGLKLILKFGATSSALAASPSALPGPSSSSKSHSDKHKKKKKKKDRKKEKEHKHRHHHKDKSHRHAAAEAAAAEQMLFESGILSSDLGEELGAQPPMMDIPGPMDVVGMAPQHHLLHHHHQQQIHQSIHQHYAPGLAQAHPVLHLPPNLITPKILPSEMHHKSEDYFLTEPSTSSMHAQPMLTDKDRVPPTTTTGMSTSTPTSGPSLTSTGSGSELSQRSFQKLLEYFLHHLQRKDVNQFFAFPVDDLFAPGYSTIIKEPMDFSTMRLKVSSGKYSTLAEFRADFELMCNNACVYNLPETIYYKAAKKLLHQGLKMMSPEKILGMKSHAPYVRTVSPTELGFDINHFGSSYYGLTNRGGSSGDGQGSGNEDDDDVSKVIEDIQKVVRRPIGRFEAIPDDMSPDEILDQVRAAAAGARNKLRIEKPKSRMGYLQLKEDGTSSFTFLPGTSRGNLTTEVDQPVNLGGLINRIKQGSISIQDRRHLARALHPLFYGSQNYESTFSNLLAEETEMVNNTYGDEVGVQYAESILNYSRNCEYAMFIVDHLLDILTGNEHRKTSSHIEEQKSIRREEDLLNWAFKEASAAAGDGIDFQSLRSLSENGFDVSFLDSLQEQLQTPQNSAISPEQLQENSNLISELIRLRAERSNASDSQPPSEREKAIATQIQSNLIKMADQFRPDDEATREAVQRILGMDNPSLRHTSEAPASSSTTSTHIQIDID